MRLIGKDIAEKIYQNLKNRVEELQKKGVTPHLVVFLIGENPASVAYVNQKQKKGGEIGCKVTILNYEETVTTEELEQKIKELNEDQSVHGILIQRPVPDQVDIDKLELLTNPEKDIDGFHPDSPYTLPLPLAVVKILEEVYFCHSERSDSGVEESHTTEQQNGVGSFGSSADSLRMTNKETSFQDWLNSQNIIVTGKGPTGGGPIINYLKTLHVIPTVIDSKTPNPQALLKQADIIIAAVGRENMIKPEMLKQEVILIGVGILRGADGKLHGDYDEETVENIASYYTPTPGGVGPVNVAMLFENVLTAAERQIGD